MIRHVAVFRWNDGVTDEQVAEVSAALDALPAQIPAEKSSGWPLGIALASSHARASARKAASSGVSSKSTAPE